MRSRRNLAAAAGIAVVALSLLASNDAHAFVPDARGRLAAATPSIGPCGTATIPPATYQHVIWIWFEDNTLSKVIGNSAAPYISNLAANCGYAKDWLDDVINNASNYVPAVAGANCDNGTLSATLPGCLTSGINPASKCTLTSCKNTVDIMSIFEQLQDAGDTWKSYDESMPKNCYTSNSNVKASPYYVRHNAPPYLSDLRIAGQFDGNTCAADDVSVPTTACTGTVPCSINMTSNPFYNDIVNNTLPSFSFVTPNACNDMHNKCSPYTSRVTNGDQWLATWLPLITGSPEYMNGSTAVFIMWDEGTFGSALPNVIVAPTVTPGTVVSAGTATINNVGALGSTENMLGLTPIGCATGKQGDGSSCPTGSTANLRLLFNI